jgi:PAS domain S-box-containing protein
LTALTPSRPRLDFHDPAFRSAFFIALLTSAAYYATAKLGFEFTLQPNSVSILWMPNSLVLAGLLLTPSGWWWLVILATLPAHLAAELTSGVPTLMVLSWFLSNSFQALFGAWLISYTTGTDVSLSRTKGLTTFLIFGAFLAPFLASFLDSALVKLNGWGTIPYWENWRVRFLSNVLASLTLIPFIVEWARDGFTTLRRVTVAKYVEASLLIFGLFAVGLVAFNSQPGFFIQTTARLYWPLPFLVWASIRFGLRGVSSCLLVVMFLALYGTTHGTGPFVSSSSAVNAMSIQGFLIIVSVPLMILAAVIEDRRVTEISARDNEERLMLALNAAQMDTWDWQISNNRLKWSSPTRTKFGVETASEITLEDFYSLVHPDDKDSVQMAVTQALQEGTPYEVEFRMVQDDQTFWYLSKGTVYHDSYGKPARMLGVGIDITDKKQAQQDLVSINARNQAILRAFPDVMFLQDKNGVYLDYFSREPHALLIPPQSFLGKSAREVLPRELADRVMAMFDQIRDGDEPQVLEYSLPIQNEVRHYEARLVSAEGQRVLSVVRDVTDMRRATETVRESEERLLLSTKKIRDLAARLITAQESERRRIAALLHDDVGQNVAALGLALSRLKRKPPATNELIIAELDRLGAQVRDLAVQIRQLSHQLHPEVLEELGLIAALESHVAEIGDEEGIAIRFSSAVNTEPIPQDVAVCLYRVALEAVRNVSMHSGARSADVTLKEVEHHLVLEVSDSGKGFDVEKVRNGSGLGLASSEERVRVLRGSLEIRSNSKAGTRLTARVPMMRTQ